MKTLADHLYECTRGHKITSPKALERCPACIIGLPCDGTLRTVSETAWWTSRPRKK